jgi:hypothetical protein
MKKPALAGWPSQNSRAQSQNNAGVCPMQELNELSAYVFERDRHEFSLGDTLDIKTGLLLASLAFLAVQSSGLMAPTLPLGSFVLQILSVLSMALGGVCCAAELWPRDYLREAMPDKYEAWISSLDEYRSHHPNADTTTLSSTRFLAAKERIQNNAAINNRKSIFMFIAFYCVVAAFAANLGTLAMRLF